MSFLSGGKEACNMEHLCLSCYNQAFHTHLHHRNCVMVRSVCSQCGKRKLVIDHLKTSGRFRFTFLRFFRHAGSAAR